MLKRGFPSDVTVQSAGKSTLVGNPADPLALQVMGEHSIDASGHVARQLTPAMLREADLVLGMERSHVATMVRMALEASGKIFLFEKWTGACDIPDPYHQQKEAFDHVYRRVDEAAAGWMRYL